MTKTWCTKTFYSSVSFFNSIQLKLTIYASVTGFSVLSELRLGHPLTVKDVNQSIQVGFKKQTGVKKSNSSFRCP